MSIYSTILPLLYTPPKVPHPLALSFIEASQPKCFRIFTIAESFCQFMDSRGKGQ
jgi:hypothetical protein